MKILVTGGAGFIASHVVDAFIEDGHDVVVLDNLITGNRDNLNPKAKFVELDIRDKKVKELFAQEKFDVVNHHAAQMDVRKSVEDPQFDADVNVMGSLNLLEMCKTNDVKQFIFSSTGGAIYGEQDYFPADEKHPQRPLSPYGITKLSLEKYLYYYKEIHGLNYFILRYANIYGPRQNPHGEAGVVAIFSQRMLKDDQPVINGDGKQTRDYVYVGDVVRANVAALGREESDVVNIGTGKETDVNELFRKIREYTGKTDIPEEHVEAKAGEQRRSVIDNSKARQLLGWQPQVELAEGLQKTVAFFQNK
ncbi:MAG: NAD-dependent epimerase/dehydratase family protein, partial [Candidatus Marinimicrobia bacterium]|nr:NAD-dependent epimerase/dehydratase family protein [Candidatus Neomarinimicrobiota bacterium]